MSAVIVVLAVLSMLCVGWIVLSSSQSSALDAAAAVRQGEIEQRLWSDVDPADLAGVSDVLGRELPTSFGARSSLVWAELRDTDGRVLWTWGESMASTGLGRDERGLSARLLGSNDGVERVAYVLPLRPPMVDESVATLIAVVADPDVGAAGTGRPTVALLVVVLVLAAFWSGGLAAVRWALRQSRGETETQRRVAMIDPLTGLANRSALNERGNAAIANSLRQDGHVGLVVVDLNRFKAVNDTGGHALGDRVLVEVGRRLLELTRKGELAVRVGGDEFAVLVPVLNRRSELESLAGRIRAALEIPVTFTAADDVRVTASVGTAYSPIDGTSIADLFRTADTLMYAEKNRVRVPLNDSIQRAKRRLLSEESAAADAAEVRAPVEEPQSDRV